MISSKADKDGVWTIGWGSTIYANGSRVKQGDTITEAAAAVLLKYWVEKYTADLGKLLSSCQINQNQFDAGTSLTYNIGITKMRNFTYYPMVPMMNANPYNPKIRDKFMKIVFSNGTLQPGLVTRRKKEADLYFSK